MESKTTFRSLDQESIGSVLKYLDYSGLEELLTKENITLNSKQILKLLNRFRPKYIRKETLESDYSIEIIISLHSDIIFSDLIISELKEYKKYDYPELLEEYKRYKKYNRFRDEPLDPDKELIRISKLNPEELDNLSQEGYVVEKIFSRIVLKKFNWDTEKYTELFL